MVVDHMKEFSPNEVYVINEYAKDMQYYYKVLMSDSYEFTQSAIRMKKFWIIWPFSDFLNQKMLLLSKKLMLNLSKEFKALKL